MAHLCPIPKEHNPGRRAHSVRSFLVLVVDTEPTSAFIGIVVQTGANCEKSLMPNVFCSQVCEREFFRTALASVSLQDCLTVYGRLAQAARERVRHL